MLIVSNWQTALPLVSYACPSCEAVREMTIDRWERGGGRKCLRCGATYLLPTTTLTPPVV